LGRKNNNPIKYPIEFLQAAYPIKDFTNMTIAVGHIEHIINRLKKVAPNFSLANCLNGNFFFFVSFYFLF